MCHHDISERNVRDHCQQMYNAMQKQKAVSAHFTSKRILPFVSADHHKSSPHLMILYSAGSTYLTVDKDGNYWVTDVALHQVTTNMIHSPNAGLMLGQR